MFFAQRTGKLKAIDQQTMKVTTALDFAYTPEMTSQSDGLLGLALDPGFATNNWLYLLHSDKTEKQLDLSRFTVTGNTVDPASEKRLLTIPTWRGEGRANSHMAGSLAFDKDGNLYAATGDNTDPFASDGFNPIDESEGLRAWDAQGTAGNTNDLRGKILRITPKDDGTYTVPEGNLFAPGTEKTRPEIYAMGMRNPFRITTDPLSGALMVADYGPDAKAAVADRGPRARSSTPVSPRRGTSAGRTASATTPRSTTTTSRRRSRARSSTVQRSSTIRRTTRGCGSCHRPSRPRSGTPTPRPPNSRSSAPAAVVR